MCLKFAIIQSVVFIFTEIHMRLQRYQSNGILLLKPLPTPQGELKGLDRGQNSSFLNMDMLHITLKIVHASNMAANVNP